MGRNSASAEVFGQGPSRPPVRDDTPGYGLTQGPPCTKVTLRPLREQTRLLRRGGGGGRDARGGGKRCPSLHLALGRTIGSQLTVSTNVSSCSGRTKRIRALEHVQVQLSLSYSRRGDLEIALTSPMGTTSTLVSAR